MMEILFWVGVPILLLVLSVVLISLISVLYEYGKELVLWNNGKCPKCNRPWTKHMSVRCGNNEDTVTIFKCVPCRLAITITFLSIIQKHETLTVDDFFE